MTTTILAALRVDDLAARFLPMLVDATIKGSVLLALAGVTLMAMRRASAAARQLVLLMRDTSRPDYLGDMIRAHVGK